MAIKLVTGNSGGAHVTSADAGALNACVFGTGKYVLDQGGQFALTVDGAESMTLGTGEAMINGRHVRSDSPTALSLDPGAQGTNRVDLVVLRYTRAADGIESATAEVIKGTPTSGTAEVPAHNSGSVIDGAATVDLVLYRVPITGITPGTPQRQFVPKGTGVESEQIYSGNSAATANGLTFNRKLKAGETILICFNETKFNYYNSQIVENAVGKKTSLFTFGVSPATNSISFYGMGFNITESGMAVVKSSDWEVARAQMANGKYPTVVRENTISIRAVYVLKGI